MLSALTFGISSLAQIGIETLVPPTANTELGAGKGNPSSGGPANHPRGLTYSPVFPNGQGYAGEVEPNGTFATASPLAGTNLVVRANLFPNGDVDFFSFSATAGDRIYAAIMTSISAGSSTDSQLTLLASDGTTVIEFDDDNGSFAGLSSSIAGAVIPSAGTYFLRVNDFTAGTTSERPYELHLRVQTGAPTPEVESNDTPATANPLPANGWVSGTRNPAAATEQDWFSMTLAAGDTVYLSLDVDPEDDLVVWNGRLGIALFGDANNQILVIDDAGTGDVSPLPNRPSEALFMTVKNAGTYFAFVDSASAAVGGPTSTYHLSVSVHPAVDEGVNCTTYTSTNVPQTIGPGTGLVSSTITVPGNPRIADLDVSITLSHALMQDIDAHLRSPAGNDNGLFTDIGAAATGGQTMMDVTFDDEAGIPPGFTVLRPLVLKPENNSTAGTASTSGAYRLSWFDGENAGGVWTLDLRDDTGRRQRRHLDRLEPADLRAATAARLPTGFRDHHRVLDRLRIGRRGLHPLGRPGRVGAGSARHGRYHHRQPGRGLQHMQQRGQLLEDRPRRHLQRLEQPRSVVAQHQSRRSDRPGGGHLGAAPPDRGRQFRPHVRRLPAGRWRDAGKALRVARSDPDQRFGRHG
ncbi:MAG: hypothetical protein HC897_17585 [Thermoanaerobaculia bacterium]|nr:hypothetical protein [Thermoanaerobaculia bacterium]